MLKLVMRWVLALLMVGVGITHFTSPDGFVKIMPAYLPWHLALVYISGFFEILGGVGLLIPKLQRAAAWGLIALFIAVLPANINMAIHGLPFGDTQPSTFMLWARIPMQLIPIAWCWWLLRDGVER